MERKSIKGLLSLACLGAVALAVQSASAVTLLTSTTGVVQNGNNNPVSASATFAVNSPDTLTITLNNLESNISAANQLLTDIKFTLDQSGATLSSSSAVKRTVFGDKHFTDAGASATNWTLDNTNSVDYHLHFHGPTGGIIGAPAGDNKYDAANASIKGPGSSSSGTGTHSPFLAETATFNLHVVGINDESNVGQVSFSFGTDEEFSTPGHGGNPPPVPEPASLALLPLAVAGLGLRKKFMAK